MAVALRIRNWSDHFENNRTRELKHLSWVPLPNKHDGDGYTELIEHKNGTAHFGVWVAIVQVASKCDPRGTLLRDGATGPKPHDSGSLSRMTRIPKSLFDEAIPRLQSIGWIESVDVESLELMEIPHDAAVISQDDASIPQDDALNGKKERREGNAIISNGGKRSKVTWLTPFYELWKTKTGGIMKCGLAGKELKPLVDEHGTEKVVAHLGYYLDKTDHEFISISRFAETFGKWVGSQSKVATDEDLKNWTPDGLR